MTKRRIIWLLCAVSTFIVFYFFIPNSVANLSPLLIATIGAALLTFFSMQVIADYRSFHNFQNPSKDDPKQKLAAILVLPGLAMVFVFYMHFYSNEKAELMADGEKVTGIVLDGSGLKSRRGGSFDLVVTFTAKTGQSYTVTESVGEQDFGRVHTGQRVDLIYSRNNPEMIQLLINDVIRKGYEFEGEEKDITVSDLFSLMELNNDSLGKTLNRMNYLWTFDPGDSTWHNEVKELYLRSYPGNAIMYISFDITDPSSTSILPDKYEKQLAGLKFRTTESDTMLIGENDQYVARIQTTTKKADIGFVMGKRIEINKKRSN